MLLYWCQLRPGAAMSIISPEKNICSSHPEALKFISLEALSCDDDGCLKHLFNSTIRRKQQSWSLCRFSTFMKGDSVTFWDSVEAWAVSVCCQSSEAVGKNLSCCLERLPDGSRCSFIKFWNLVPYIRQKSILCHQTISYRINDPFSFLHFMFSWFIVAHQSFTVHISTLKKRTSQSWWCKVPATTVVHFGWPEHFAN